MPDIVRGTPQQYIPVKQTEVIKPHAYLNSTPPVHKKGFVNGTGKNTISGASTGFSFGGPVGAAIGGVLGLGTDIWQAVYAKKRAKEANEEAKQAAARASAQNANEARAARNYNSEQAQIRRLRMAGLSPGLAYGNMSPSTAQPASAEKADISKADTPKFDNESILRALELLVKQQQADTQLAAQQSSADLQGSQTQLNLIDALTRNESNLANIRGVLSSSSLNDAQKLEVLTLLFGKKENLDVNTRKTLADALVTEGTGIDLAKSIIGSNKANARNANANANVTEKTGVDLANSQIFNNNTSGLLHNQMREQMEYQYNLDKDQMSALQNYMDQHGIDESYAPIVLAALQSIAVGSGTTVNKAFDDLLHLPFNLVKTHIDNIISARNSIMSVVK